MDIQQITQSLEFGHSKQVSKIIEILAVKAGYPPSEVAIITQAAAFHDIGKNAIPAKILNKPSVLTAAEFEIVKTHTRIGYEQLLDAARILSVAAMMAREHHEHVDGRGGYHNISGADIHPYAKLIAVADVYDALSAKRAYKEPWSNADICRYFKERTGTQFDADTVRILLDCIDDILALYTYKTNAQKESD